MKSNFRALALMSIVLAGTACNASRVSGTYVAHTPAFAEMLQLTQTADGKISGVLSTVELMQDGSINSKSTSVSGTEDAGQITLTFPSILSFISSSSLAGTISGSTIHLQSVANGQVSTEEFVRGTPEQFNTYTAELKTKGEGIAFSTKLLNGAQELRDTARNAENWLAYAELHAGRISNTKNAYDQIDARMKSLLAQERATQSNTVARTQIVVAMTQAGIAGDQVDIQVRQIWDNDIGDSGSVLNKQISGWGPGCTAPDQLQKRGASARAIESWESACTQALVEREKFMPLFKRVMEQRAEVKSLEATAEANRKAIVQESDRLQ